MAVQTATDPHPGTMFFGGGNAPTNYNIADLNEQNVELGLKLHVFKGADFVPTSVDTDGTAHYSVTSGISPLQSNRADWNFDYVVDTGINHSASTLGDFGFKIVITELAGSAHGTSATFDLDPASHVWVNETHAPGSGFGGDDFNTPASAAVESKVAENSVNIGFVALQAIFGPLASSTAPSTQYDIQLEAFSHDAHGNHQTQIGSVHDVLTLV